MNSGDGGENFECLEFQNWKECKRRAFISGGGIQALQLFLDKGLEQKENILSLSILRKLDSESRRFLA